MKQSPSSRKKKVRMLAERAEELLHEIASLKMLYNELEEITLQLVEMNEFNPSRYVVIEDNFAKKNVSYKTTSVKRYEIYPTYPAVSGSTVRMRKIK